MPDRHEAFRRQAISDLDAYEYLVSTDLPACHGIHYLQMVTEKLGRAVRTSAGEAGADAQSHVAIVKAMRLLRNRREAAHVLFEGRFELWRAYVDRLLPLVHKLERMAPAVAGNTENPEYPWESRPGEWTAPAAHRFEVAAWLRTPDGSRLMLLLRRIADRFNELFA